MGPGIKLGSLPGQPGINSQGGKYDVSVTTRSQSGLGSSARATESEEELKQRESDELFILREGRGIMKSVNVSVHR